MRGSSFASHRLSPSPFFQRHDGHVALTTIEPFLAALLMVSKRHPLRWNLFVVSSIEYHRSFLW